MSDVYSQIAEDQLAEAGPREFDRPMTMEEKMGFAASQGYDPRTTAVVENWDGSVTFHPGVKPAATGKEAGYEAFKGSAFRSLGAIPTAIATAEALSPLAATGPPGAIAAGIGTLGAGFLASGAMEGLRKSMKSPKALAEDELIDYLAAQEHPVGTVAGDILGSLSYPSGGQTMNLGRFGKRLLTKPVATLGSKFAGLPAGEKQALINLSVAGAIPAYNAAQIELGDQWQNLPPLERHALAAGTLSTAFMTEPIIGGKRLKAIGKGIQNVVKPQVSEADQVTAAMQHTEASPITPESMQRAEQAATQVDLLNVPSSTPRRKRRLSKPKTPPGGGTEQEDLPFQTVEDTGIETGGLPPDGAELVHPETGQTFVFNKVSGWRPKGDIDFPARVAETQDYPYQRGLDVVSGPVEGGRPEDLAAGKTSIGVFRRGEGPVVGIDPYKGQATTGRHETAHAMIEMLYQKGTRALANYIRKLGEEDVVDAAAALATRGVPKEGVFKRWWRDNAAAMNVLLQSNDPKQRNAARFVEQLMRDADLSSLRPRLPGQTEPVPLPSFRQRLAGNVSGTAPIPPPEGAPDESQYMMVYGSPEHIKVLEGKIRDAEQSRMVARNNFSTDPKLAEAMDNYDRTSLHGPTPESDEYLKYINAHPLVKEYNKKFDEVSAAKRQLQFLQQELSVPPKEFPAPPPGKTTMDLVAPGIAGPGMAGRVLEELNVQPTTTEPPRGPNEPYSTSPNADFMMINRVAPDDPRIAQAEKRLRRNPFEAPEETRQETGVFKKEDNVWREIIGNPEDIVFDMNVAKSGKLLPLRDILTSTGKAQFSQLSPETQAEMQKWKIVFYPDVEVFTSDGMTKTIKIGPTADHASLVHEVQHALQSAQGETYPDYEPIDNDVFMQHWPTVNPRASALYRDFLADAAANNIGLTEMQKDAIFRRFWYAEMSKVNPQFKRYAEQLSERESEAAADYVKDANFMMNRPIAPDDPRVAEFYKRRGRLMEKGTHPFYAYRRAKRENEGVFMGRDKVARQTIGDRPAGEMYQGSKLVPGAKIDEILTPYGEDTAAQALTPTEQENFGDIEIMRSEQTPEEAGYKGAFFPGYSAHPVLLGGPGKIDLPTGLPRSELTKVMGHEGTHGVQAVTGLPQGSNTDAELNAIRNRVYPVIQRQFKDLYPGVQAVTPRRGTQGLSSDIREIGSITLRNGKEAQPTAEMQEMWRELTMRAVPREASEWHAWMQYMGKPGEREAQALAHGDPDAVFQMKKSNVPDDFSDTSRLRMDDENQFHMIRSALKSAVDIEPGLKAPLRAFFAENRRLKGIGYKALDQLIDVDIDELTAAVNRQNIAYMTSMPFTPTLREGKLLDIFDAAMHEWAAASNAVGIGPRGINPHYVPHMVPPEKANKMINDLAYRAKALKEFLDLNQRIYGPSFNPVDAEGYFTQYIDGLATHHGMSPFNALVKGARQYYLPDSIRETNPMKIIGRYNIRAAREIARAGTVQKDPIAQKVLGIDPGTGIWNPRALPRPLMDIVETLYGSLSVPTHDSAFNEAMRAGTSLAGSVIMQAPTGLRNLVQTFPNLGRTIQGWDTLRGTIAGTIRPDSGVRQRAIEFGAIDPTVTAHRLVENDADMVHNFAVNMQNSADNIRGVSGAQKLEEIGRIWDYSRGEQIAKRVLADPTSKEAVRWMEKFGPNVLAGDTPEVKVGKMASNYVTNMQGSYSPEGLPAWMLRPGLKSHLGRLARYGVENAGNVADTMKEAWDDRNIVPFLGWLAGGAISATGIAYLNKLFSRREAVRPTLNEIDKGLLPEDVARKNVERGLNVLSVLDASNMLGIFSQLGGTLERTARGAPREVVGSFALNLYEENILKEALDAAKAIENGADPRDVIPELVQRALVNTFQNGRVIDNWLKNKDEVQESVDKRDKRIFSYLSGLDKPTVGEMVQGLVGGENYPPLSYESLPEKKLLKAENKEQAQSAFRQLIAQNEPPRIRQRLSAVGNYPGTFALNSQNALKNLALQEFIGNTQGEPAVEALFGRAIDRKRRLGANLKLATGQEFDQEVPEPEPTLYPGQKRLSVKPRAIGHER